MSKFTNLLALTALLFLAVANGPQPVSALSIHARSVARSPLEHGAIAKRKRGNAKRCKPRSTQTQDSNNTKESASSSSKQSDNSSSSNNNNDSNNNNNSNNDSANTTPGDISQLGFAWVLGSDLLPSYKQSKTTLIYNWNPTGPSSDGFAFAPMIWGNDGDKIAKFNAAVAKKTPEYALGPNEPELFNGSGLSAGMSPDDVVSVYWSTLHPLAQKGVKVLTPAVTSGDAGFKWMEEFMDKCNGCKFHGQALHWYDISADSAIAHFKKHHDRFGLDIYCTEIAFNNFNGGNQLSHDEAYREMHKFNMWVKGDGASFMKVVMYFGFMDDMVNVSPTLKLINSDHTPNALGQMVIDDLRQ